jgi:hypothetical protein
MALSVTSYAVTFDVPLTPDQSVPTPTLGGADPSGMTTVDVNTITGAISVEGTYTGTTSNVVASHLHGLAAPGETAGVITGFTVSGRTAGTISGSGVLSSEDLAGLLSGQTYVNVHTENNGPGEIRGQVVDPDITVFNLLLDPSQAVPAPMIGGANPMGTATVVVDASSNEVEIAGAYSGMTSDVVAAHLHGLAGPGETAGVLFGFDVTGGTDGSFSGAATVTSDVLSGILSGQTYVNVHTMNNGPGEIRAQVVPEPASHLLLLLGLMALRRRSS